MRRVSLSLLATLVFLGPVAAYANSLYFEFKPDYGDSLLVVSAPQPVEQLFLPLNDHVSAFDIWASNDANGGNVTFELYDQNGILRSSVVKFIPPTPDSLTGTRFGVVLPAQIPTTANQPYFLRTITNVPSFRMYHATQRSILTHNSQSQAAYTGGLARLGGQEQTFAFTFALYEDNESTAPVISNVSSTVLSVQDVRLDLNASEPVDITVQYGPPGGELYSRPYSGQYTSCPEGVQVCSVTLEVFNPGTEHDFTLAVRDVWGNTTQVNGSFTSLGISIAPTPTPVPTSSPIVSSTPVPTPDSVPPVISNARAAIATHESATIAWTTNEAATSLVVITFGIDDITIGGNSDSTLELEHAITIPGLAPLTPYTAEISSSDTSGNESTTNIQFTTTAVPATTPPPSQSPTPIPTVSVGPSSSGGQEVSWVPPTGGAPAGGYRVDIIGPDGKLIRTIYTDDTSADLGNLPEGARIVVYADNGDGLLEKVASPAEYNRKKPLLEGLVVNLPYILAGLGIIVIAGALLWRRLHPVKPPAPPPSATPPTIGESFSSEA